MGKAKFLLEENSESGTFKEKEVPSEFFVNLGTAYNSFKSIIKNEIDEEEKK